MVALQHAARVLPRDGAAGLHLRPTDLAAIAQAYAALGDEVVDAALALFVAGVPVLDGAVLDLGVLQRHQFHHGGVQLVLVADGGGATFEVAHIRALIGDQQRALELAGHGLVDAEVGAELHGAAHARWDVAEAAIAENGAVQGGEVVVGTRHHAAEVLLDQVRVVVHRFAETAEDDALLLERRLKGGLHAHAVEHHIHSHAHQTLLFFQRDAQLLEGLHQFGIGLVQAVELRLLLGRAVVVAVLVVDLGVVHMRPVRLLHLQPQAVGLQPPLQHPLGLVLLRADEADDVLVQPLRGLLALDVRDEAVGVLLLGDLAEDIVGVLCHFVFCSVNPVGRRYTVVRSKNSRRTRRSGWRWGSRTGSLFR